MKNIQEFVMKVMLMMLIHIIFMILVSKIRLFVNNIKSVIKKLQFFRKYFVHNNLIHNIYNKIN